MKIKSLLFVSLLLLSTLFVSAQQFREIKGKVVDNNGEPLIGVSILNKSSRTGSITDFNGNFTVSNVNKGDVFTFSYVGYTPQEVKIEDAKELRIVLSDENLKLDEVVVVAYGSQKKATLTGALSSIGTADLLKSPSAGVGNALAGAMTGVSTVQYSGRPGADDAQIFIRGVGSLTESASSPLILVDGVERPFSQLDPNEIENITVLKDASSTAVFGVRGANGVVLITTKRGAEGTVKIGFTSSFGLQEPTRLLKNADSYTYASAVNETYKNDGFGDNYIIKANIMEMIRTKKYPLMFPDINWREELMKKSAAQTQHNLTISGGTKSIKYFTSVGFLFQDGLFKIFDSQYNSNFNYNRINYRSNIDIDVTNTLQMQFNIGGRVERRNEPVVSTDGTLFQQINWASPLAGAGVVDGKYIRRDDFYFPLSLKDGLLPWYGRGYKNSTRNVLNIDFVLNQKLDVVTKGLVLGIKASYNGNFDYIKTRTASVQNFVPYFRSDVDPTAPGDSTIVLKTFGTSKELDYGESYGKTRDWYMEAALRYKREFKEHNVSALLLYNQSKKYYPGGDYNDIPSGYVGFVGRATYDYSNKYLFEFNLGYNGSENFAPGKTRYGVFPAVSGGWVLTEEQFMKKQKVIDNLKIRASYGMVGNDKLDAERFLYLQDSYTIGSRGYNFGTNISTNLKGADEGKIGYPGVTWEKSLKQNYGIDLAMLKNKLLFNLDIFDEYRYDILTKRKTNPGYVIAEVAGLNLGKVRNAGYEVTLKWDQKINKFRYFIQTNLSYSRNKILFMDEIPPNETYLSRTGLPVGVPFGKEFYAFYKEGLTYPDGTPVADHIYSLKPGDAVFYDLNKDGIINDDDERAIGYGNRPEYVLGLRGGINYKNFDFTMQWTGATNVDRVLSDVYRTPMGGATTARALFQYMYDERWTPETAETAKSPRYSIAGLTNNYANSTLWVRDASYLRLKNLEIGYNFNAKKLKIIGISNLRLYMNGYNLLTFDNLKVLDPEEQSSNGGAYPITKVYNVGMNVQF